VLASQQNRQQIRMIVNQTLKMGDGRLITAQLQRVVDRFVSGQAGALVKLVHLGDIPSDNAVREALQRRQLLFTTQPGSPPALALAALAGRLQEVAARWG
jgi:flagellar biosynthesis protein FlhG